ncbi:MAG: peptide chain release factor N(5)-glutamine methyltransferase [Actinomycetota bacterium]
MAEPIGHGGDDGRGVTWAELAVETGERLAVSSDPVVSARADWQGRLLAMRAAGAEPDDWHELSKEFATVRGVASLDAMTARRLAGEPLQYVLGEWGFRYLELFVDKRVLIPRPETEIVASAALDEVVRLEPRGAGVVAVDLGTGSGAIGLSLAYELDGVEVWLTDVSTEALQVARANLAGIGRAGGRVRVAEGSWFEALPAELVGTLGLIVSNPPYVADGDRLPDEVADWEPVRALFGGPAGTDHLELLIAEAPRWLRADGALVLEMSPDQTDPMADEARRLFHEVEIRPDLTERARAVVARHPR